MLYVKYCKVSEAFSEPALELYYYIVFIYLFAYSSEIEPNFHNSTAHSMMNDELIIMDSLGIPHHWLDCI